jgi:hypothetical protein
MSCFINAIIQHGMLYGKVFFARKWYHIRQREFLLNSTLKALYLTETLFKFSKIIVQPELLFYLKGVEAIPFHVCLGKSS